MDEVGRAEVMTCGHPQCDHAACDGQGCGDCDNGKLPWCIHACGVRLPFPSEDFDVL